MARKARSAADRTMESGSLSSASTSGANFAPASPIFPKASAALLRTVESEPQKGRWRVRFRWKGQRYARTTALAATTENRTQVEKLAKLVAATIAAGKSPLALFEPEKRSATTSTSETVRQYCDRWITDKVSPMVRRAQARDYRRHIVGYVLPRIGSIPIERLTPRDIVGLQAELLARPLEEHALLRRPGYQRSMGESTGREPGTLSVKTVRNIFASLRALLRDAARIDEIAIKANLFGGLQWPRGVEPGPEPFEASERDQILAWFKTKRFGLHAGRPGAPNRKRLHPSYHAYLHTLFWTGMRPSEAAGLGYIGRMWTSFAGLCGLYAPAIADKSTRRRRGRQRGWSN
jgi:hypothetical protein